MSQITLFADRLKSRRCWATIGLWLIVLMYTVRVLRETYTLYACQYRVFCTESYQRGILLDRHENMVFLASILTVLCVLKIVADTVDKFTAPK